MAKQPHIVVFLTDDHGRWALGCYDQPTVQSPNIDYLARTGVRMDQAYTTTPVCSPARASFWTGALASGHGLHDYIEEYGSNRVNHPGITGMTNLGQSLQEVGYETAMIGKWHAGGDFERPFPGFDRWFTLAEGTNARFAAQPFIDQDQRVERFGHQAPLLTDEAVRVIEGRDESKPLFMYVGLTDTHTPHTGQPERLLDRYREADFAEVPLDELTEGHGYARLRQVREREARLAELRDYAAAVTMIDEQVGRVMDALESAGMLDETLLVYTSDHGHMNGHLGLHTKGNATIPQNLLDGSIRIPCVMRWPGQIEAGQVNDEFVDQCDLHATLLNAAGTHAGRAGDGLPRPGRSFLQKLKSRDWSDWRDMQYCEYGNARMIRTRQYKLICRYPGPNGHWPDQLYDLTSDPREEINRIDDPGLAEIRDGLAGQLEAYFDQYERPEKSGKRIADQIYCNSWQPWTREIEAN